MNAVSLTKGWRLQFKPLPLVYQLEIRPPGKPAIGASVPKEQAVMAYLQEDELSGCQVILSCYIEGTTQVKTLADNYRVTHYERGFIPGCNPPGSNLGMIGQALAQEPREPVYLWLNRLRLDINQNRQTMNERFGRNDPMLPLYEAGDV